MPQPPLDRLQELIVIPSAASNWSADRVVAKLPEFNNIYVDSDDPIYFFREMVRTPYRLNVLLVRR